MALRSRIPVRTTPIKLPMICASQLKHVKFMPRLSKTDDCSVRQLMTFIVNPPMTACDAALWTFTSNFRPVKLVPAEMPVNPQRSPQLSIYTSIARCKKEAPVTLINTDEKLCSSYLRGYDILRPMIELFYP